MVSTTLIWWRAQAISLQWKSVAFSGMVGVKRFALFLQWLSAFAFGSYRLVRTFGYNAIARARLSRVVCSTGIGPAAIRSMAATVLVQYSPSARHIRFRPDSAAELMI